MKNMAFTHLQGWSWYANKKKKNAIKLMFQISSLSEVGFCDELWLKSAE